MRHHSVCKYSVTISSKGLCHGQHRSSRSGDFARPEDSVEGRGAIARREGTVLTAYRDSAGILTIGTGHTSAAGEPKVTARMKIIAWEADQILTRDLVAVEKTVNGAIKVPLNQNEFDALVSLTFNIGGAGHQEIDAAP